MGGEIVPQGHVFETDDTDELRAENRRLRTDLAAAQNAEAQALRAGRQAQESIRMLRQQLGPLYKALQAVFGEIEAAGVPEGPQTLTEAAAQGRPYPVGQDIRVVAVWESWKQKLGPTSSAARVIDALLVHGEMNVAQLKVAAKMATQTVYDAASKLNRLGLINKNGGRYSLKKL